MSALVQLTAWMKLNLLGKTYPSDLFFDEYTSNSAHSLTHSHSHSLKKTVYEFVTYLVVFTRLKAGRQLKFVVKSVRL